MGLDDYLVANKPAKLKELISDAPNLLDGVLKLIRPNLDPGPLQKCLDDVYLLSMVKADGTMVFNPSADTLICAGGSIIAVGSSNSLVRLEKILNP